MRALLPVVFIISLNAWAADPCGQRAAGAPLPSYNVWDLQQLSYDDLRSKGSELFSEIDQLELDVFNHSRTPVLQPLVKAFSLGPDGALSRAAQREVIARVRTPQLEHDIRKILQEGAALKARVERLDQGLEAVRIAMKKHLNWFSPYLKKVARGPFRNRLEDYRLNITSARFLVNIQTRALQTLSVLSAPSPRQVTPTGLSPTPLTGLAFWEWYYFYYYLIEANPSLLFSEARTHTWNFQHDYLRNGFADYYQQIYHFLHPHDRSTAWSDASGDFDDTGAQGGASEFLPDTVGGGMHDSAPDAGDFGSGGDAGGGN